MTRIVGRGFGAERGAGQRPGAVRPAWARAGLRRGSAGDRRGLRALLGLLLVLGCGACGSDDPERPSLVLITVDRLAADRLPCFGGPADAGTSLCELARSGTLFGWAMTPVPEEGPAAASVLTGLAPADHGLDRQGVRFLAEATETLAEELAGAGYATAAFVASPRLSPALRLDQGFQRYEVLAPPRPDAGGSRASLRPETGQAEAVQAWIDDVEPPWFLWIHARADGGLDPLERLVDRLASVHEHGDVRPGLLFVALAGEPEPNAEGSPAPRPGRGAERADPSRGLLPRTRIGLRSHRVPLIWRPPGPAADDDAPPPVSWALVSLLDVAPTLANAAGLESALAGANGGPGSMGPEGAAPLGRDLGATTDTSPAADANPSADRVSGDERFVLLRAGGGGDEVGLVSARHFYVRRGSSLDGTGRAVPTSELSSLAPRFATRSPRSEVHGASAGDGEPRAALRPTSWRTDVLGAESPVPRLEFHLARQLDRSGTRASAPTGGVPRPAAAPRRTP